MSFFGPESKDKMKIRELVKKTGVSKETIHYYIREGLLRKPRKFGKNVAEYNENHVEQIRIIKALRDNYFLPVPLIKKLLNEKKKLTPQEKLNFRNLSLNFKPMDRLFATGIYGRKTLREATGMGSKWLKKLEDLGIISSEERKGQPYYSFDDVISAKAIVAMTEIDKQLGPEVQFDPLDFKPAIDEFRSIISKHAEKIFESWDELPPSEEVLETVGVLTEMMSGFFYHTYHKIVREEISRHLIEKGKSIKKG
jgi:DNA-binding transcriptional MerR regulator